MCGITGIHFKNPRDIGIQHKRLEKLVDELLLGIEHRGQDATGLLTVDAKGVPNLVKADCAATVFLPWRDPLPRCVRTILGHTRWATQGTPKVLDNNHPIQYGSVFAIHNGHINNDTELFREHSLDRIAEVDSEIIPALFDKYGLDKADMALEELEGSMATAVVDPDRFPNQLILAKGYTSPVHYVETKYALMFASTEAALQDACKKALGFNVAKSSVKSMTWGEMLRFDGDKIVTDSFRPKSSYTKPKSWRTSSSTTTYGSNGYSYSPSTGRQGTTEEYEKGSLYDLCSSCKCKRLWHENTGGKLRGACTNTIELAVGGYWECRCEAFVEDKSGKLAYECCDGCGREFPMGDLKKVGKNFFCPSQCALELFNGGPTTEELRKSAELVIAEQVQTAYDFDGDEFSDKAWTAREEKIHEQVLALTSKSVGLTVTFIEWLLFKAPMELFEADESSYLAGAYNIADEAYKSVELAMHNAVADIDFARIVSGDVDPTEEEEEVESCGVVIEMYPASCVEMD